MRISLDTKDPGYNRDDFYWAYVVYIDGKQACLRTLNTEECWAVIFEDVFDPKDQNTIIAKRIDLTGRHVVVKKHDRVVFDEVMKGPKHPMIPVHELENGTMIYAKRSEVGGIQYFSDDIGGGQLVVDMSTVDMDVLEWIIDNHERNETFVK